MIDILTSVVLQEQDYETVRSKADALFDQAKYRQANDFYKKIFRLWPKNIPSVLFKFEQELAVKLDNIDLRSSLANLYIAEENDSEAIDELEEIIEKDPCNIDHYKILARLYFKDQYFNGVIDLLQRPYQLQIYDEELVELLASSYLEAGMVNKAIKVFERLTQISGENEGNLRTLSDLYFRNDQITSAVDFALKRLKINPGCSGDVISFLERCFEKQLESEYVNERLIDLYIFYNRPDKAIAKLGKYLETLDKEDFDQYLLTRIDTLIKEHPDYPEALILQADFFIRLDRFSEAADIYKKLLKNSNYEKKALMGLKQILEVYPEQVSVLQYLSEYYKNKGDTYNTLVYMRKMLKADVTKSLAIISQCKDLVTSNPNNGYAKLTLAEAYLKKQDFNSSISLSLDLIKKGENTLDATEVLINSYISIQDYNSVRQYLNDNRDRLIESPEFYSLFKKAYQKELSIRIDNYRRKNTEENNALPQPLEYIRTLIEGKMYEEAIVELQQIVRKNPEYRVFYYQGICFVAIGNYYSAIGCFKKALDHIFIESSPEYLAIMQSLANVYEIIGEIDAGLDSYRKILENSFDREDIKNKEIALKNCPYLDVTGKSLIIVPRTPEAQDFTVVFNRNIFKRKGKESFDASMGVLKNNEAVDDIIKGKINSAEGLLEIAYKIDPTHKNILNNKGIVRLLRKDYEAASEIFAQIVDNKRSLSATSLYNLAFINGYILKDYSSALKLLKKLYEFETELFEAYLIEGDFHYFENNINLAFQAWEKYSKYGLLPHLASERLLEIDFVKGF